MPPRLRFRSRAVIVVGVFNVVLGSGILTGGGVVAASNAKNALPLGLAISIIGMILLVSGLGRVTSRLDVRPDRVSWHWNFSEHFVAVSDLEDSALVEKGRPASGSSWVGFLGDGIFMVPVWWLLDLLVTLFSSGPSLGGLDLVLIKHHGGPVDVRPISAWGTHSSHSQANQALTAIKVTIGEHGHHVHQIPSLLHDAWETNP